jgi:hypothetical protein
MNVISEMLILRTSMTGSEGAGRNEEEGNAGFGAPQKGY